MSKRTALSMRTLGDTQRRLLRLARERAVLHLTEQNDRVAALKLHSKGLLDRTSAADYRINRKGMELPNG